MEDYKGDTSSRRRQVKKNIESLEGKLKQARNAFQMSSIADELSRLEQERMHFDTLFEDGSDGTEEETPQEEYPILNTAWAHYANLVKQSHHLERDVRASILYMSYFEDEFLGMFTSRKLRLDVKFSVERDSFYDLFHQVNRSLDNYKTEADRISEGTYAKQYEGDVLKRKVEMRHAVLVEIDWFYRKANQFAMNLLEDIEGDGLFCQNPDEELNYTNIDKETVLRGKTVQNGIEELHEFAKEVIEYLEIPDFQQRPL